MAADLGFAPIEVLQNGPGGRQFWYVRYIDWVVTTPLLVSELLLGAGLPTNIILSTVFADVVMIICGLIGGLVPTQYKWAFFVFGCVAMFWVFWNIFFGNKICGKNWWKEKSSNLYYSCFMDDLFLDNISNCMGFM